MRTRRLRKPVAHLEVTAFINVIVVLVPFLLSTAVFTRLSVMDLTLPTQSSGVEQLKVEDLKLEVVIRPDSLEVGDRIGGLIQRIAQVDKHHDLTALSNLMQQIKLKFPEATAVTVLAQPDTPYDLLIQVMDGVREVAPLPHSGSSSKIERVKLFPDVSIGDAPVRAIKK
ncbi:MAG: biopolymer transporter ExbD [Burkholderiaceae bacterium]|jgi:biopolymer transport protein ExbD|nr:biopolymer transporter ExbD [Burkholderiaceae bacterium]MDZ4143580.1 biopolymer transporter ExbD [Burkholderiales bacterium]PKO39551.1 MAG: biopolymer transporter ExbD [Betaproteobacteria bacterium HGW-Betaproteobacteria-3]